MCYTMRVGILQSNGDIMGGIYEVHGYATTPDRSGESSFRSLLPTRTGNAPRREVVKRTLRRKSR